MSRRYAFPTLLLLLLLLPSISTRAQSTDRVQLESEIVSLREQLKLKERQFLSPSAEDRAAFAEFLSQPETGLIRLLPGEKYQRKLTIVGGGAYYSFARLTQEYGGGSDIELQKDQLSVGFAGADFGYLVMLGDVPLETVTLATDGAAFLNEFTPPSREPEARTQQRVANEGFKHGKFTYQNRLPARVGQTYVVRSVNYDRADTLVAFRVIRQDSDGSLILLWKMLRKYPTPPLTD